MVPFGQNVAVPVEFVPGGSVIGTTMGAAIKFAVTFCAEFIVKVHAVFVPKLEHAPPHPANVDGEVGFAVRMTVAPAA